MAALDSEVDWLRSKKQLLKFILASRTYGKRSLDSFLELCPKKLKGHFSYQKQDYALKRENRVRCYLKKRSQRHGMGE